MPHLFLGFPTRYFDRGWTKAAEALPRLEYRRLRGAKSPREGTAITDGMFMSSRDGKHFQVWPESFIRPGLRTTDNWFYGDNYQNWGLVETKSAIADAPKEMSMYVTERDRAGAGSARNSAVTHCALMGSFLPMRPIAEASSSPSRSASRAVVFC